MENKDFFEAVQTALEEDTHVSFFVKGTSMLPFFKDGKTEVFLRKEKVYKKNDICLFYYKGKYILHRLIYIQNNQEYLFQADNGYLVEQVDRSNIIGRVYQFRENNTICKMSSCSVRFKTNFFLKYKKVKKSIRRAKFWG